VRRPEKGSGPAQRPRTAHELAQEAWDRIQDAYAWGDGFQGAYDRLVALFKEAGAVEGYGTGVDPAVCSCEPCRARRATSVDAGPLAPGLR
jgi:hypothetical protein